MGLGSRPVSGLRSPASVRPSGLRPPGLFFEAKLPNSLRFRVQKWVWVQRKKQTGID